MFSQFISSVRQWKNLAYPWTTQLDENLAMTGTMSSLKCLFEAIMITSVHSPHRIVKRKLPIFKHLYNRLRHVW